MKRSDLTPESHSVLLIDYGGVLGDHHIDKAELELASQLGVDRQTCCRLISERSEEGAAFREDRISESEFWDRVVQLAQGVAGPRPANARLSRLWAETYAPNASVLSLLKAVRASSPVGVLTNIDRARSAYLEDVVGILNLVDVYLPSYRFGAIKPKPALWRAATEAVEDRYGKGVRIAYVDDRESHVKACASYGWVGVLYTEPDSLRSQLVRLGFLDAFRQPSGAEQP